MSSIFPGVDIIVVDSVPALGPLLNDIDNLPVRPPSLFVDLEGDKLGRHGTLSVLSLYVVPKKTVYLVDVLSLGELAFSTTNEKKRSLKGLLESSDIPKVFFDVRNDSDALFNLHQISLNGVEDVQLMELATRKGPKNFVAGLAKCVQNHCALSKETKAEWQHTKTHVSQFFDVKKEGRHEFWNQRPLTSEMMKYCAHDTVLLPNLYNIYSTKLQSPGKKFWLGEIRKATEDRVKLSQSVTYEGHGKDKARGPWNESYIEDALEQWNEDVMFTALHEEAGFENDDVFHEDDYDDYQDTARDCIGWEEDMDKNGECF